MTTLNIVWCQFIDWLKFVTRPSSLRNSEMANQNRIPRNRRNRRNKRNTRNTICISYEEISSTNPKSNRSLSQGREKTASQNLFFVAAEWRISSLEGVLTVTNFKLQKLQKILTFVPNKLRTSNSIHSRGMQLSTYVIRCYGNEIIIKNWFFNFLKKTMFGRYFKTVRIQTISFGDDKVRDIQFS